MSLITYGASLYKCLQAADELASAGVEAEVIDLRCLRPLDEQTSSSRCGKTHRAVVVDEGWRSVSVAAEVGMRIMEQAFYELDAPVSACLHCRGPVPYAKHIEDAALPQVADRERRCRRDALPQLNSACPLSGRTWNTARSSSGGSRPAMS